MVLILPQRWLVEDEKPGFATERGGERGALLLAHAEGLGGPPCKPRQPAFLQQSIQAAAAAAKVERREAHLFPDGGADQLMEGILLEKADPPSAATSLMPYHTPIAGPQEPSERPRQGGLPSTVRAHNRGYLAISKGQ